MRQHAPGGPRLRFGYKIIDAATGETLAADKNAELFTPASNNKLFTTAFALLILGPDYRFTTELRTPDPPGRDLATISGLQFIGGGDPNLSGRQVPFRPHADEGDVLAPLRRLAAELKTRGVSTIDGDIVGVATRYPEPRYPEGWAVDDLPFGYGAPVSSLVVNDNTVTVRLQPTEDGELAALQTVPAVPHFQILNRVVTSASAPGSDLHVEHPLGSNELILWGEIARNAGELKADLAVEDPALFAAECLRAALEDEGIAVRGDSRARYRGTSESADPAADGSVLATRQSAPISELIAVVNKVSQNLHAEMLLREAARARDGASDPAAARQTFLDTIGIMRDGSGILASDGSGLAREDKLTPDATVALLRFMWQSPFKDIWLASLPIGGLEGTLEKRFSGMAGAGRIHAKTGFLGHVNTLSGYAHGKSGRWFAFSFMADDTLANDSDVRAFLDAFCAVLLDE